MSFVHLFIVLPIRIFVAVLKALFHSWMKLRWTPSSKSWLMRLDAKIRSHITHMNNAEWVSVNLGKDIHKIWTVTVEGDQQNTTPVVIIHGMGGGSNMFLNNIDALATKRKVILIDLPGFGMSSRPELRIKYEDGWWVDTDEDDVETFYIEVLERWFEKMNLQKVVLLGHSYGAYICSIYCLKYPARVKHLILADPWGFPQRPAAADMRPFMRSKPLYLLSKLYAKMNIFTPIRVLGPLAVPLCRIFKISVKEKYIAILSGRPQDLGHYQACRKLLRQEDYLLFPDYTMQDYVYLWLMQSKSGEIGFSRVSIPFGWARKPLIERVAAWDPDLDVTFIYGARSWVDSQPGFEIRNQRHGNYVDVHVIGGAGHHVYADRPLAFNNMVHMICQAVDQDGKPDISSEYEQRHLAMSSLRRRASCLSQAELCNDEAGVHQLRSLSAHELMGSYDMIPDPNTTENSAKGEEAEGVKFSLDSVQGEEDLHPPTVTFNVGGDTLSLGRKSTLKTSKSGTVKNVKFSSDNLTSFASSSHTYDKEESAEVVEEIEENESLDDESEGVVKSGTPEYKKSGIAQ